VHEACCSFSTLPTRSRRFNATNGDLIWEYKRDLPEKLLADFPNVLAKRQHGDL